MTILLLFLGPFGPGFLVLVPFVPHPQIDTGCLFDLEKHKIGITYTFIATARTEGLVPNQREQPALPNDRFFHNGLLTSQMVAQQSRKNFLCIGCRPRNRQLVQMILLYEQGYRVP